MELIATSEIEQALAFLRRWPCVEIEIGSGNGHFLIEYGQRHQTCGLLGIEIKNRRCGKIEKKIRSKRLYNVLLFHGRAEIVFERLAPETVDAVHLYFPDPWPKTKHRRRRLVRMPAVIAFHRVLKPGGRIYFISDVFDYYLQAKILGALHGGFTVCNKEPPPEAALSMFCRKMNNAGKAYKALVLEKKGTS